MRDSLLGRAFSVSHDRPRRQRWRRGRVDRPPFFAGAGRQRILLGCDSRTADVEQTDRLTSRNAQVSGAPGRWLGRFEWFCRAAARAGLGATGWRC
jgi:hypothetical protein